jgi:hypothetical protein
MRPLVPDFSRSFRIELLTLLFLAGPCIASGQSFVLHGGGGPTLIDGGYSLAAGIGFSPTSHLTVLVDVERTHLASRLRSDRPGSISAFRGGTLTLGAAELRIAPLGHNRIGPYGLAGFAAGQSRPNVNEAFPDRVTNDARAAFFGAGIGVPLGERVGFFVDGRLMLGEEAGELLAVVPIRAGFSWRF